MSGNSTIDLSQLPAPDIVEPLDYETLYRQRRDEFLARVPIEQRADFEKTTSLDSEPVSVVLQEGAYRELVLRNRINAAAKANMLAYATKGDLDNLAALLGTERLVLASSDGGDGQPATQVLEQDEDLRRRAQLAPEGLTAAGSRGAYQYYALSAHVDVADVFVDSPAPGEVSVHVMSRTGDGRPDQDVLGAVHSALSAEDVRPLCDYVTVHPVGLVRFSLAATLYIKDGPAQSTALDAATAALNTFLQRPQRIGSSVPLSALYAALHQPGVARVEIHSPLGDIVCTSAQAAYCTSVVLTAEAES